jgi:hypothetical protein
MVVSRLSAKASTSITIVSMAVPPDSTPSPPPRLTVVPIAVRCRRECWLELARVISGRLKVADQAARSIC